MSQWKLNLFTEVLKLRSVRENRTPEDIIVEYTKLTDSEKTIILQEINK